MLVTPSRFQEIDRGSIVCGRKKVDIQFPGQSQQLGLPFPRHVGLFIQIVQGSILPQRSFPVTKRFRITIDGQWCPGCRSAALLHRHPLPWRRESTAPPRRNPAGDWRTVRPRCIRDGRGRRNGFRSGQVCISGC
jgi:hypothetical protein